MDDSGVSALHMLFDNINKLLFLAFLLIGFVTVFTYWITWNSLSMELSHYMGKIEDRIDKEGYISSDCLSDYTYDLYNHPAVNGVSTTHASPGVDVMPGYLGQPLFVEVTVSARVVGKDIELTGRADSVNRGKYSNGYNTPNER